MLNIVLGNIILTLFSAALSPESPTDLASEHVQVHILSDREELTTTVDGKEFNPYTQRISTQETIFLGSTESYTFFRLA